MTATEPQHDRIVTADGLSLSVYRWGTGEPVQLLIHGLGDSAHVWHGLVNSAPLGTSFAFDLRGHGQSDWDPLQRYTSDVLAKDAVLVLSMLDLRDVRLIGHSLGAEVAIRTVVACPTRVRELVIIDGGPETRRDGGEVVLRQLREQRRRFDSPAEYVSVLRERLPLADPDALTQIAKGALRACESGGYELSCDPGLVHGVTPPESETMRTDLRAVSCSVLVLRGARSAVLSVQGAQKTAAWARDGRMANVPRAGHAVMLDNPVGLRAALAR